jgi:hypothetical protein
MDTSKVEAKALGTAIHSLQVHNELYCDKIDGLCSALTIRQRHKGKSKPLDLQQRREFCSKTVFYSSSTVRESFVRKDIEQREAGEEKLQKTTRKSWRLHITYIKSRLQAQCVNSINVLLRSTRRRRKHRLLNASLQRRKSNKNTKLQHSKNLAIGQILSNKKLHVFRIQMQLNVVEVQLLQVVRLLNLCCHLLPPKPQRASRTIKLPDKFK